MAWVRIHDRAMTDPKIVGLVDWKNPFCLWVWGLSYCQQHLTDGVIPAAALVHPSASRTAVRLVLAGLWEAQEAGGWVVHDYLDWNDSRELVIKKRDEAKERMSRARERSPVSVRANIPRTSQEVLRRVSVHSGSVDVLEKEEEREFDRRAGELLERYAALFSEHRRGAKYHNRMHLDFDKACALVRTWRDDARLEKLAVIVLTTDDEWISKSDRSFGIFALKASWADDRLSEWEASHPQQAIR